MSQILDQFGPWSYSAPAPNLGRCHHCLRPNDELAIVHQETGFRFCSVKCYVREINTWGGAETGYGVGET